MIDRPVEESDLLYYYKQNARKVPCNNCGTIVDIIPPEINSWCGWCGSKVGPTMINRLTTYLRESSRLFDRLPNGKCFISHSYQDEEEREILLKYLPQNASPVVFPPIDVTPDEMVSNAFLGALRSCDSLVYLQGGHSDHSPWILLERDYAKRNDKRVYSFSPQTLKFKRDYSKPLELPLFAICAKDDNKLVSNFVYLMNLQRGFSLYFDPDFEYQSWNIKELDPALTFKLNRGGYALIFWSKNAERDELTNRLINRIKAKGYGNRIIYVLLESVGLPRDLFNINSLKVFVFREDSEGVDKSKFDKLIVDLYAMFYRNKSE